MKNKLKLASLFFLLGFSFAQAQSWLSNPEGKELNFKQIQDQFYSYWSGRPIEKGMGYKVFKRWEYNMRNRLLPDGSFPNPYITINEFTKYQNKLRESGSQNKAFTSVANWSNVGPTVSNGGYSGIGRLNCIAFHNTDANTFWVGSPSGGLWKTTDGGITWTTNTDNLPVLGVSDIAVHPTDNNTIYIATGDGDAAYGLASFGTFAAGDTRSIGVLKSIDGGATFTPTGLNWQVTETKLIRRLIINPTNSNILLAFASDGIWRTEDGGETWDNVQEGYFVDGEFNPDNSSTIYAATYTSPSKIYTSTDGGLNWNEVLTIPNTRRIDLAVSPANPNKVSALGVNSSGGFAGIWTSTDSGATYVQTVVGTSTNNLMGYDIDGNSIGGQGTYDIAHLMSPINDNQLWVSGINSWKSTNGGSSWSIKSMWYNVPSVAEVHADQHYLAFHPLDSNILFKCNDGGLYKTTDGGDTWTDLSNGLKISQLYRIGVSNTVSNKVMCGLQDNGSKEFTDGTFFDRTGGDGMECLIDYSDSNIQYATYSNGVLYRTMDGWNTSTTISNNIIPGGSISGGWVTPYAIDPVTPTTLYAGYNKVYKTTDRGDTWTSISSTFSSDLVYVAVSEQNTNVIYAGTFDEMRVTFDGGTTWNSITLPVNGSSVSYLSINPSNSQHVFITYSGYSEGEKVYESTNAGLTWTNISGTLPNVPVNCIVYNKNTNNEIFIGTDIGVFYKDNTMTDWLPFQTNLPNVVVTELEISYQDSKLWAGTYGRGLWSSPITTALSNDDFQSTNDFIVYPNPNEGVFNIASSLNTVYDVLIVDALGKTVYSKNGLKNQNEEIILNNITSGIYFVIIKDKERKFTKKVFVK